MNILIINFEYPPLGGGGGVATRQLARELASRHAVTVLTTAAAGLPSVEQDGGVHVRRVAVIGRRSLPTASLISLISFVPAAVIAGIGLCRQEKFNVINAQFVLPSGLAGVVLAALARVPLVISFIGGDLYDPSKGSSPHRHAFLRVLIRALSRRAQARTAISADTARHARELHGVQEPIVITHLGIEPASTAKLPREKLGLPEDAPVFISIGRLITRKNYELLLAAWAQVRSAHLFILGAGPLRPKLEHLIQELGLRGSVTLTGFVSEAKKQQLLAASDGYISAADHEGFGLVFLEAMQAGLPIVATNQGGHLDFLRAEENALLVTSSASELADAVQRLLTDRTLAARLGSTNAQAVRNFYLDQTAAHFESVLTAAVRDYARSH